MEVKSRQRDHKRGMEATLRESGKETKRFTRESEGRKVD